MNLSGMVFMAQPPSHSVEYICSKTLFVSLRTFVGVKSVCVYVHLWKSHNHSAHLRFARFRWNSHFRSYFSTQESVTIDDVCLKVQPPKPCFCLDQSISPPDHLFILASQASQPVLFKGQIPKPWSSLLVWWMNIPEMVFVAHPPSHSVESYFYIL